MTNASKSRRFLALIATAACISAPAALSSRAQALAPTQVLAPAAHSSEISLRFGREPVSRGVTFVPDGLTWGGIDVEGKKEGA